MISYGGMLEPAIIKPDPIILLDNGHAKSTPGKKSLILDGKQLFEYEFNRDIVQRIAKKLEILGIKYHILVPEVDQDIPVSVRAQRANNYCNKYGKNNCYLISIHANAFGETANWNSARGWSVYTTKGITASDKFANILFDEAQKLLPKYGMTVRNSGLPHTKSFEDNFTVIYKSWCPAVLTENLFYTNKKDCAFLMSEEGREIIADIHINAIKRLPV